jgi:4-hydroxybenzoate polyprenyltransferase
VRRSAPQVRRAAYHGRVDAAQRTEEGAVRAGAPGRGDVLRRPLGLALACHPLPTVAVTLLVTGFAAASGVSAGPAAVAVAAVLAGQLSVGWSNDAIDAARDTAAGRRDKPVSGGRLTARAVWWAALVSLVLCVPLSLGYGLLAGAVHLVGVAVAWAYNLRLKATWWSWLPYAAGFASLPAFVVLGLPGRPAPVWWIVAAAALLGVGAHLGDVLPDIADDLAAGVRGLPQRLGPAATRLLMPVPLVAATLLLALGRPGVPGVLAVGVAAGAVVWATVAGARRPRVPFLAAVLVAGVDVVLLLWQGAAVS